MGECSKCGMKVKMARCAKSVAVRLVIEDKDRKEHKATGFNEVVEDIIRELMLAATWKRRCAPPMKFSILRTEIK